MGRVTALAMIGAAGALVACGSAMNNSWSGDEAFTGNAAASWLDYPESDLSLVASEIDAEADGFALGDGRATVSMHEMTCGVHIDSGTVFFDLDLRPGEVQDGLDVDRSGSSGGPELTSVLVAPPLVALVPVDRPFQEAQFLIRGVREARLLDDRAFVALRATDDQTCELRWYDEGRLASSQVLDGVSCDGDLGFAVDRATGDAFVASPSGVFAVTGQGVQALPVDGDLLGWDTTHEQLYVGSFGSDQVHAVHEGQVAWTLNLPGGALDLDDAGDPGGVVVAFEEGLGYSVDRFDAAGVSVDHLSFDQPVLDVAVSDRGGLMGIARQDDHAYYRLQR